MAQQVTLKRKNIDLPVETLQRLSLLAVAQGKSLKKYIENLLISKANSVSIEVHESPSPSGEPWFDDPENLAIVAEGVEEYKRGETIKMSIDEVKSGLGL